jgi:hypothetical protein
VHTRRRPEKLEWNNFLKRKYFCCQKHPNNENNPKGRPFWNKRTPPKEPNFFSGI